MKIFIDFRQRLVLQSIQFCLFFVLQSLLSIELSNKSLTMCLSELLIVNWTSVRLIDIDIGIGINVRKLFSLSIFRAFS